MRIKCENFIRFWKNVVKYFRAIWKYDHFIVIWVRNEYRIITSYFNIFFTFYVLLKSQTSLILLPEFYHIIYYFFPLIISKSWNITIRIKNLYSSIFQITCYLALWTEISSNLLISINCWVSLEIKPVNARIRSVT